jgi:MEKHLA domain
MPIIRIDFDNEKVSEQEMRTLSVAAQKIVSEITQIEDVFVYANSSRIKLKITPIEVFVEMSAHKIADPDKLIADIKAALAKWKQDSGFSQLINLTLIPMNWKIEIGI